MEPDERDDPFVVVAFRQFYAEVLRLKEGVKANPHEVDESGGRRGTDSSLRAARVSDLLLAKLRRQEAEARRRGGEWGAEAFRDAQYAMATLADEVFLSMPWEGRTAWASNLLEARLFGSYVGGERLFDRIDDLLQDPDPVRVHLGAVYLMVLSLGFQGRFEGRPDARERTEEYRRRLFDFVYPDTRSGIRGDRPLFAQAYENTASEAAPERLPATRRWVAGAVAAFALYVVISHGFWRSVARGVEESTVAVEQLNERAAGR
jgi:type VI secretion system protein ImpK